MFEKHIENINNFLKSSAKFFSDTNIMPIFKFGLRPIVTVALRFESHGEI